MSSSRNLVLLGTDSPPPEPTLLRAGPLSLFFEQGELRHINLGDNEVLRRIYVAVRDRHWRSIPPIITQISHEVDSSSFKILLTVQHKEEDIDFSWDGLILGSSDGDITFAMQGVAHSTFLRNRIGFCVLHSTLEFAGRACTLEKIDGSLDQAVFPRSISPYQPFLDLRALTCPLSSGISATICFTGDTFETEDQRNWGDASYKTYSTPLSLPYPVEIAAGTSISQQVSLSIRANHRSFPKPAPPQAISFALLKEEGEVPLPRIGLGVSSLVVSLDLVSADRLRALNLTHLRVDLDLSLPNYVDSLKRATLQASQIGVALEIALYLPDNPESQLRSLRAAVDDLLPSVCTWLVFSASHPSTNGEFALLARKFLADFRPAAKFAGGSNEYFAGLNRFPPPLDGLDLICYPLSPQVHASDETTLRENLPALGETARCAREIAQGLRVVVSPVSLKPRSHPDVAEPFSSRQPGQLPPQVDQRQTSLFGAGWTLGSLKYISDAGVYSSTHYETLGWCGVMETPDGSPLPELFRSTPGAVFPLYHVFADFCAFAGGVVLSTSSSAPAEVTGLALNKGGCTRILLANLTSSQKLVQLHGLDFASEFRIRSLDEESSAFAVLSPEQFRSAPGQLLKGKGSGLELELLPFAVVTLDPA